MTPHPLRSTIGSEPGREETSLESYADAAAVPGCEGEVPGNDRVFPNGGFLRDVL